MFPRDNRPLFSLPGTHSNNIMAKSFFQFLRADVDCRIFRIAGSVWWKLKWQPQFYLNCTFPEIDLKCWDTNVSLQWHIKRKLVSALSIFPQEKSCLECKLIMVIFIWDIGAEGDMGILLQHKQTTKLRGCILCKVAALILTAISELIFWITHCLVLVILNLLLYRKILVV